MSQKKCSVITARGIGDGLVSLVLSNNLHLNGWKVSTYHPSILKELQSFFPHLPIFPFPSIREVDEILESNEKIFVSFDGASDFVVSLIEKAKRKTPEKLYVINPSPSKNKGSPASYNDIAFDLRLNMVDNLERFCRYHLHLDKTTKSNGVILPLPFSIQKEEKRVVIHPTSGRIGRNWPRKKFVKLALHLKKKGYEPVFVMNQEESLNWSDLKDHFLSLRTFPNLKELAFFIASSSFVIGNDSGIGHLASTFDIPTVIICRNYRIARLWRPGWKEGNVVFPLRWIPNFSPFRLRDKRWKQLISVKKVLTTFYKMKNQTDYLK